MSHIHSTSLPPDCRTFGDLVHSNLSVDRNYNTNILHVICDSYVENSLKAAERLRRESGIDPIEYNDGDIKPDLPLLD